jgi:polyribonucleotide nucleotidyltransferase
MWKRLENMDNVFQEGDKVKVKLVGIDPKTGKFKLSRKALLPKPEPSSGGQRKSNSEK